MERLTSLLYAPLNLFPSATQNFCNKHSQRFILEKSIVWVQPKLPKRFPCFYVTDQYLFVLQPLDFEGTPTKTLLISAENEEPYGSCQNTRQSRMNNVVKLPNVTVSITVIDSNDAPIFTPGVLVIREKEGVKVGTVLGTFTANDPDMVQNKIRYSICISTTFNPKNTIQRSGIYSTVTLL